MPSVEGCHEGALRHEGPSPGTLTCCWALVDGVKLQRRLCQGSYRSARAGLAACTKALVADPSRGVGHDVAWL